jgi:hypothetical protein
LIPAGFFVCELAVFSWNFCNLCYMPIFLLSWVDVALFYGTALTACPLSRKIHSIPPLDFLATLSLSLSHLLHGTELLTRRSPPCLIPTLPLASPFMSPSLPYPLPRTGCLEISMSKQGNCASGFKRRMERRAQQPGVERRCRRLAIYGAGQWSRR